MSALELLSVFGGAAFVLYTAFLRWLIRAGRRDEAAAAARFIPDCAVLFPRVLADDRTPRSTKLCSSRWSATC